MPDVAGLKTGGHLALIMALALGGCGKIEQKDPQEASKGRAEAKRRQVACASSTANNRLKSIVFDQAIGAHATGRDTGRASLDTLADYSLARMDDPVVTGWDPTLDITRCKGRLILQVPPGAERAFDGETRLQANVVYTAQAAADGSGLVYQLEGAGPIVEKLAAFNLSSGAYRPPPAIDQEQATPQAPKPAEMAQADTTGPYPDAVPTRSSPVVEHDIAPPARRGTASPSRPVPDAAVSEDRSWARVSSTNDGGGEATVRAFYQALSAGDGGAASARIIPEKRSGRTYSPDAMSRFYGRLAEPIRLTTIVPVARGAYRVTYRYSTGRSRCEGSAIVRLADRDDRTLIRSIDALNGC